MTRQRVRDHQNKRTLCGADQGCKFVICVAGGEGVTRPAQPSEQTHPTIDVILIWSCLLAFTRGLAGRFLSAYPLTTSLVFSLALVAKGEKTVRDTTKRGNSSDARVCASTEGFAKHCHWLVEGLLPPNSGRHAIAELSSRLPHAPSHSSGG